MSVRVNFANFSYKVKALLKVKKKPIAKVYNPWDFERKRNAKYSSTFKWSESASTQPNEPVISLSKIKDFFGKLFSGIETENEAEGSKSVGTFSTGGGSTTGKNSHQSSYDVEAMGEDEFDSKEDTKLLQESEDEGDDVLTGDENKGNTSSLQAGWNISNLIQGEQRKESIF